MPTFTADWVVPISGPPIRHGSITVAGDRVTAVGERHRDAVPLGSVAIVPALVNAHTHLELSYLHGRVPPGTSFNDWAMALITLRRELTDHGDAPLIDAARAAIAAARAGGTGLIGDVGNTLISVPLLRDAAMPAHVFHELLGFNQPDAAALVREARARMDSGAASGTDVRVSLAPHAPYSVSPRLFAAIRADLEEHGPTVTSLHLGESAAEVEFLRHGTGPTRVMLERLGVWTDEWRAPGMSPTEYASAMGFLGPDVLVVHGVQFTREDLARVAEAGSVLVSCPRSNTYVGAGSPPLESFYSAGVPVAFGTDSLASVADLDMFAELAEARRIAPAVSARNLLRSATLIGARALRRDDDFGSIEVGKRASLLAVRVPPDVDDVEEYLVRGVEPGAVTWLDARSTAGTAASAP